MERVEEKKIGGRNEGEPATQIWNAQRWKNVEMNGVEILSPRMDATIERDIRENGWTGIPYEFITVDEMKKWLERYGGYCDGDFEVVVIGGE